MKIIIKLLIDQFQCHMSEQELELFPPTNYCAEQKVWSRAEGHYITMILTFPNGMWKVKRKSLKWVVNVWKSGVDRWYFFKKIKCTSKILKQI